VYNPEKYKELADLPSKEELLTKFVVGLNYPMTSLAISLKCTMTKFVNVLYDLKNKKN
jgi:ribosomal protein L10